jgi:TetR/AcrR family transcriptional regulator, transcriptional repressor for nem operon
MRRRAEDKDETHRTIVAIAGRRLRELGIHGAGVARIMGDAGLTHGGFYAHFASKTELVREAMHAAFTTNRRRWLDGLERLDDATWLRRVLRRYLNPTHRDTIADGCPFAALASEVAREGPEVRQVMQEELMATVERLAEQLESTEGDQATDRAIALAALCGGGILMARAVADPGLSDQILEACQDFALRAFEERSAGRSRT